MDILLVGASGQLGRALHGKLAQLGDVAAPSRMEFDLAREDSVRRGLNAARPELIVNAAAYTDVDRAEKERDVAQKINTHAPAVLAQWAATHDTALLHYSSDYVFDGKGRTPYRESDPAEPVNFYGETKRAGEVAVAESRAEHLIIRTSWLYDAQGANFLRTILRLAKECNTVRIVEDQIGAPTPAWWLAEASVQILQRFLERRRSGLLHVATAGTTSWYGFAKAIIDGARDRQLPLSVAEVQPIATRDYPKPAVRPENSVFDLTRLRTEFYVNPPHWRDALSPVLDDFADAADKP